MYSVYTTSGFIVGSKVYGEAGKIIFIFTRDFGLVSVVAQGVRLEKSKLRYNAQDYAFGTFSLVRGKEFWRLTYVALEEAYFYELLNIEFVARIALLLRRLLQGEHPQPELFDCVLKGILFSRNSSELNDERLKTLESVTVFRILGLLGYIGNDSHLEGKLKSSDLSYTLLDELVHSRTAINQHINKALKESHL